MKNPYQLSPIGISSQFDSKKLSSALLLPKKPFLPVFIFRPLACQQFGGLADCRHIFLRRESDIIITTMMPGYSFFTSR
jgi:hypothetical protein